YWMRYFNTSEWLIAPSNYTKKILVSHGLNAKKIIVVPNPIDIKLQKNVKKESNLILHVGRLSPEKRVDVFIKSLKYVKHNFKAVITSDGPLRKYLEELAKKEGVAKKVKFTGFIPKKDLDNYYSKSAIFVSAAEYDTFNNCVAEALGHGTPVIISKNSGATDFVKHNKNGIIINNDDPIEYAKKIDWMLFNNEFRETVNKAGEKIRAYTDINVIIKSIEELYKNATRSSFFKKLKDFTIYSIGAIFCYTVIIGGSLLERK
ncbi:MAG TPA: glycosyltransferase family 4 protein, partial [Candidatus Nanoarchaeia archaeon]|nr:glycosyltransferase family 4 protein [Candidatus Nanoarchaeia archaeon]